MALKFLQTHTDSDNSWTTTTLDKYPADGVEQAPKAVVQTLELSGSTATRQKQAVVTRAIPTVPTSSTGAPAYGSWFVDRVAWLKWFVDNDYFGLDKLEVVFGSGNYGYVSPGQVKLAADGTTSNIDDLGWTMVVLPNELAQGSVTPWMEAADTALKTAQVTLGICLSYIEPIPSDLDSGKAAAIRRLFNMDSPDPEQQNLLFVEYQCVATNAQTQVYSKITDGDLGETAPTGLAQEFYSALNTLHYEGSFETTEEEISRAIGLGNTFNLSGGRTEWAEMAAVVQQIRWAAASGKTTVTFGPPEHLNPQDMVEFIRGQRKSVVSGKTQERQNGQTAGNASVSGTGWNPANNTTNPPSGTVPTPFSFQLTNASTSTGNKMRVAYGTLAGKAPDGMSKGDTPPYILPVSGACVIYGGVTVDDTGNVTARWIASGASTPLNDDTNAYIEIGSVSPNSEGKLVIAQALTWSPDLMACRRWFEAGVKFNFTWL